MSRYDGLIIPRSYSEYINKTDAATLLQALQQSGVMDAAPTAGSNHPVKSGGVAANYGQGKRILFAEGQDLNTVISIGEYYANTDALANSLVNRPSFSDGKLYGCSMSVHGSTNGKIVQILHTLAGDYLRYTSNYGSTWSTWNKVITDKVDTVSFTVVTAFGTITIKRNGQIVQALMNGSSNAGIAPGTSVASGLPHPITTNFIPVYKYSDQTIEGFLILDNNGYLYAYNGNTKNLGACVFNFSYIAE